MRCFVGLLLAACGTSGPTGPGSVTVWNGRGGGMFELGEEIRIPNARLAIAADLDVDGRVDVLAIDGSGVTPLMNVSEGHLEPGTSWRIDEYARGAAIGDLDADSVPDLVLATHRALLVYTGDAHGGYTQTARLEGGLGTSVAIADLDGNGSPDLITVADGNEVSAYLNDGTGRFGPMMSSPTGYLPYGLALSDMNEDSRLDVITINAAFAIDRARPPSASVLLGTGNGTFTRNFDLELTGAPYCAAVGDLDKDGHVDLVIPDSRIYGLLGDGSGGFRVTDLWSLHARKVALANLTGGDVLDLIAIDDELIRILVSDPAAGFVSAFAYKHDEPLADIAVADLNGDGLLDLVATSGDLNL